MSAPILPSGFTLPLAESGGQIFFKKITLSTDSLRAVASGIDIIQSVADKAIVLCQPVYTHSIATTPFTTASNLQIIDTTTTTPHCTITSQALTSTPTATAFNHRMSEPGTSTGNNLAFNSNIYLGSSGNPTEGGGTSDLTLTLYLFYYFIDLRT